MSSRFSWMHGLFPAVLFLGGVGCHVFHGLQAAGGTATSMEPVLEAVHQAEVLAFAASGVSALLVLANAIVEKLDRRGERSAETARLKMELDRERLAHQKRETELKHERRVQMIVARREAEGDAHAMKVGELVLRASGGTLTSGGSAGVSLADHMGVKRQLVQHIDQTTRAISELVSAVKQRAADSDAKWQKSVSHFEERITDEARRRARADEDTSGSISIQVGELRQILERMQPKGGMDAKGHTPPDGQQSLRHRQDGLDGHRAAS